MISLIVSFMVSVVVAVSFVSSGISPDSIDIPNISIAEPSFGDSGITVPVVDAASLEAPKDLKAENKDGGICLTWTPVENASNYAVYRGENKDELEQISAIISEDDNTASCIDKEGIMPGVIYSYYVAPYAYNGTYDEEGPASEIVSMAYLDTPVFDDPVYKDGKIYLSWSGVEGASSYRVYYKVDGGDQIKEIATESNFVIEDVKSGSEYDIHVRASLKDGDVHYKSGPSEHKTVEAK